MSIGARGQLLWNLNDRLWNLSVCSQFPNECRENDPYFSHSDVLYGATLPMQIAQHQEIDGRGTHDRLKIIQTMPSVKHVNFLQFFGQSDNENVVPGDYLWRENGFNDGPITAPSSSLQIFDFYLPEETYNTLKDPVGDDTFTATVLLEGLKTVDNPYMRVRGGQVVDLLVICAQEDYPLPQFVGFVPGQARREAEAHGDIAKAIASSKTLRQRVADFTAEVL